MKVKRDEFYSASPEGETLTPDETAARIRAGQELSTQRLEHLATVHRLDDAIRLNALVSNGRMSRRRAAAKFFKRAGSMRLLHWSLREDRRRAKREAL